MAYIYVNYETGSDVTGSGSNTSPFRSIQKGVTNATVGDNVVVLGTAGTTHIEPDSVYINNKTNITVQIEPAGNVFVQPETVSRGFTFVLYGCSNVKIVGFTFTNSIDNVGHEGAVLIENSLSQCEVRNCVIHSDWEANNLLQTNLFKGVNSDVIFSNNTADYLENSYPVYTETSELSFIRVSGNGLYTLTNNECSNFHSNSGWAFGLKIDDSTREVLVDNFKISNFIAGHIDVKSRMIGIDVNTDNSALILRLNNIEIDSVGYGVRFRNIPSTSALTVKRVLVTNALYSAVLADENSSVSIRNFTIASCANGLEANHGSILKVYNTIIYRCEQAYVANNSSLLQVMYSIYFENTVDSALGTGSKLETVEFTRKVNPKLVNPDTGNYGLADYSPGIDTGKLFDGDAYAGFGTDIGFYERGPLLTNADIPSLLARSTRLSSPIPLTAIDVLGVIEKGLETADGTIIAGREGSAIRDVAVKPLDLLLAPYFSELESLRSRQSFSQMDTLTEDDADLLASNLFVTRDPGMYASGIVRIYFSEAQDATVFAQHEFKSAGGLLFYVRTTVSLSQDEMLLNYDNSGYYLDVIVDAAKQDYSYNLLANEMVATTMPLPTGVTTFTNPFAFSDGRAKEDNVALKEKTGYSITVRDIVTKKGAKATMLDTYPTISDTLTIGFRDEEMERDVMFGEHIGGKTDIYIKPDSFTEDSTDVTPVAKLLPINDSDFSGFVPLVRVTSIEILEPLSLLPTGILLEEGVHYSLKSYDHIYRYSIYESLAIEFSDYVVDTYMPTTPMRVYFDWIPEMKTIQSNVSSGDERVVVADIMVRTFDPTFVSFTMSYYANEEIDSLDVILQSFIDGLRNTAEVQESDLVNLVYSFGATKVIQPMELSAEYHYKDGSISTETSLDAIVVDRTSAFWAGDITVNYLGVKE